MIQTFLLLALASQAEHQADMRYAIVPATNTTVRDLVRDCISDGHCHQHRLASIRVSNDGALAIVKWRRGSFTIPPRIRDYVINNSIQIYTHAEILALLASDPNWRPPP